VKEIAYLASIFVVMTVGRAMAQDPDQQQPVTPLPTFVDVQYGPHDRNLMDVWLVKSERPTPVLLSIHGGGFRRGDKKVSRGILKGCLASGISVVAITYRYSDQAIAPAQFLDAARAVQFVRHKADEWNLDPFRVAATGGSAGAGLSLWLGFHEDLGDPKNEDPVLRRSTRLTCMAVNNGQSSYDPRFIRDLFPRSDTYQNSALAQLFDVDLTGLDDLPQEKYRLFEEVSALNHLTHDDVPVLMTYDNEFDTPVSSRSIGIHHPRFGKVLEERMEALGIECKVHTGFGQSNRSRSNLVMAFLRRHFYKQSPEPTTTAETGVPRADFEKIVLTPRYFCDGIQAGDINRDGHVDVVAGPYWYEGPEFTLAHEFYPAETLVPEQSPSNSMFSFVHDFSGDGWPDILVLGRVHLHPAYWYENPANTDAGWRKHFAFERVRGESPTLVDIDGDGRPQLICHWDGRWGWIEPNWDTPGEPWEFHSISVAGEWKQFYHGTGVGDLNSDGRLDLVINDGWFLQPPEHDAAWTWQAHRFSAGRGGAQMLVYDIDGDGDSDVVSSLDAHGWGLAWFEQYNEHGVVGFRMHPIMGTREEVDTYGVAFSQPHALDLGDIDGDGLKDLVVGKRMWAHGPRGDIEPSAHPVLYWFKLTREKTKVRFVPHLIDQRSGVGVQVTIADVNGDGANDILTASKLGSFVFLNQLAP